MLVIGLNFLHLVLMHCFSLVGYAVDDLFTVTSSLHLAYSNRNVQMRNSLNLTLYEILFCSIRLYYNY
jgi:hypothetical protein